MRTVISIAVVLSAVACCLPAYGSSTEEMGLLRMFYRDNDLVVSATRVPKPVSQVAENVTVIGADEIEAINAHTLGEVLKFVTGVQVDFQGGFAATAVASIQGAPFRQVLVMIDNVPLNNVSDAAVDLGAVPVQFIERVEIVKGPASSSWGSSLGGVINIITKEADPTRRLGGSVSASIGERNSGDYRGELAARADALGGYLQVGKLISDGIVRNDSTDGQNLYGKLRWEASSRTTLRLSLGYSSIAHRLGAVEEFGLAFHNANEYLFTTLALEHAPADGVEATMAIRGLLQQGKIGQDDAATGAPLGEFKGDDTTVGGSAKLALRRGMHHLIAGMDYDHGAVESDVVTGRKQTINKGALFLNDSITIGRFSVTPGLRYDDTSTSGDFLSPSLGATCRLGDSTVLRASFARGFSTPPLGARFGSGLDSVPNPDLKMEEIWSMQAGVESALLHYLWLKTTIFRHDISDVLRRVPSNVPSPLGGFKSMMVNQGRELRQGVEVEARTVPFYNTSLMAGYVFVDATDRDTHETITNVARQTCDLGVDYSDDDGWRGALRGHYIWWNTGGPGLSGRYRAFIWDLTLGKRLYQKDELALEAFFSAHNIFNGAQYMLSFFKNPGRWLEGGVRIRF